MKPNIKRISELSGFSTATVSNALNNKKGVNQETSARIFRVAKEIGYNTVRAITKIKLVIFRSSGQIVSDTPFFASLINGVESQCRISGYQLIICNLNKADPGYEAQLAEILSGGDSAVLLLATELEDSDAAVFAQADCPLVVLDNWIDCLNFDCVLMDNTNSSFHAVEHLANQGHKEIGCLTSSIRINNFKQREMGYLAALQMHGLAGNPSYMVPLTPTLEGSYKDMLEFLKTGPQLPTAYFAANDIIALGAMKALKECGYRLPKDISVIGFDDMPFCEVASPTLTTVQVHKQEMGEIAVRQLISNITQKSCAKTIIQVGTALVERESVLAR